MKLLELLEGAEILTVTSDLDLEIHGVSYDSRSTRPGDLFVAMPGFAADGHRFIAQAVEKGAAAVVCERLNGWPGAETLVVQTSGAENSRTADDAGNGGAGNGRTADDAGNGGAGNGRTADGAGNGGAGNGRTADGAGNSGAGNGRTADGAGNSGAENSRTADGAGNGGAGNGRTADGAGNSGANGSGSGGADGRRVLPFVQVTDARRTLAVIGANFYGHPAERMVMVGVTGTNGKTTSTYLLKAILEQGLGAKVGLIGTNQNMIGSEILPTERTTPESFELQGLFARMLSEGCTHVVMEVSSHALALHRVYGVPYEVGVFTNLTQDHLDFHETMENYCQAKAILFDNCRKGAFNADDPWTENIVEDAACSPFFFGVRERSADLRAEDVELGADHVAFTAVHGEEKIPVRIGIPGGFTVYNTLDALAAGYLLGAPLERSAEILRTVPPIKGRVEPVPTPGKDYTILIDYAHSPDGLENVLKSVKGFARGRTVALFGCGGDRDRTKRPKMGKIAAELADFVIVTTDNPRTEKPADIIGEILPGMEGTDTPYVVAEDRVRAIHYAMDHAQPGDVIVLCGKGHETYQEINHVKHHMDEREIVADHLAGKDA